MQKTIFAIQAMHDQYRNYVLNLSPRHVDIPKLKEAHRLAAIIVKKMALVEKKGNKLLQMALKECGMEQPTWTLSIDKSYNYFDGLGIANGTVRFTLNIPNKDKWKGNIRHCPLFKVMKLEFPVAWLWVSDARVREAMRNRLSK